MRKTVVTRPCSTGRPLCSTRSFNHHRLPSNNRRLVPQPPPNSIFGLGDNKESQDPDDYGASPSDMVANALDADEQSKQLATLQAEVQLLSDKLNKLEASYEQQTEQYRDRTRVLMSKMGDITKEGGGESVTKDDYYSSSSPAAAATSGSFEEIDKSDGDGSWDPLEAFSEVMSKGYLSSVEKLRERLMTVEWQLNRKQLAMKAGVARFENLVFENEWDIPYETLTKLYEDPDKVDEIVLDEKLRKKARSTIQQSLHSEYISVYNQCTSEAQQLARRFSQTEFMQQLVPESGIIDALKKIVVPAIKLMM